MEKTKDVCIYGDNLMCESMENLLDKSRIFKIDKNQKNLKDIEETLFSSKIVLCCFQENKTFLSKLVTFCFENSLPVIVVLNCAKDKIEIDKETLKKATFIILDEKKSEELSKEVDPEEFSKIYAEKLIVAKEQGNDFNAYFINQLVDGVSVENSTLIASSAVSILKTKKKVSVEDVKKYMKKNKIAFAPSPKISFGTSGSRQIISKGFTSQTIERIAYALTKICKEDNNKKPSIVIGYDHRYLSKEFAEHFGCVMAKRKAVVGVYAFPVPTPLITYLAKKYDYGIMITASHNPFFYNGIKIYLHGGREADDEFTAKIMKYANEASDFDVDTMPFDLAIKKKLITLETDLDTYCDDVIKLLDVKAIKKANPKILYNAMYGNSACCVEKIMDKLGLKKYKTMHKERNPKFGGILPAPYLQNLGDQVKEIKKGGFDVGFALDGDGDRISCVDTNGEIYDCNYLIAVFYYYLAKFRGKKGGVVKNCAQSNLCTLVAEKMGYKSYDAKVGFKHTGHLLLSTDAFIGGESNGIALKELSLSKDGVMCAMLIINVVAALKKTMTEIINEIKEFASYPCTAIEFAYPISAEKKAEINEQIFVKHETPKLNKPILSFSYADGYKMNFDGGYWAVIRFSGNENVVRIFSEEPNINLCNEMVAQLEDFIGVKTRQQ